MAQLTALAPDLTRTDDLPVGVQLAWRIRVLIASGQLEPGDRLPGVRELAKGTGINGNTARAARAEGEPTHPLLRPKGHIPDLGELEEIRDELMERLKRARTAAERRGEGQWRARTRLEEMASDPGAHRWESISNEDIGEPGCT